PTIHYSLSLHDALPISKIFDPPARLNGADHDAFELACTLDLDIDRMDIAALDCIEPFVAVHHEGSRRAGADQHEVLMNQRFQLRSEEHTSELQSRSDIV